MVRLEDIHVRFNPGTAAETHALRAIDLTVQEHEFVTIIGSNGAGKSSLLNVIAGEILQERGAIRIDGKDITPLTPPQRARFVARVFQDPLAGSCGAMTIAENLALAYKRPARRTLRFALSSRLESFFAERVALLGLGLETRLRAPMESLSGGQRQAVALLMASLQPSRLLLLDEHCSALDPVMAERVLALTSDFITRDRATALMVTHSMQTALATGTRTIMMDRGEIVFDIDAASKRSLTVEDLLKKFSDSIAATDSIMLEGRGAGRFAARTEAMPGP